jgi:DNA repair protein RecN (Recombination protein N)
MLSRIEIRDFALIEQISLEPGSGLLILTGETGAGKSILIDAIGALSGGRIARDMVRHGAAQAAIDGIFHIDAGLVPLDLIEQLGLNLAPDPDEEAGTGILELVVSREVTASGKSTCRINGRLTALTALRALMPYLIDIHGQHDQQAIFAVDSHLPLLDRYAGEMISADLSAYRQLVASYQACLAELNTLGQDPASRARQVDLLTYQIEEIAAAGLRVGEDERLSSKRRVIANAGKIREALAEAYERLSGDAPDSLQAGLGVVLACLATVSRHTRDLSDTGVQLELAMEQLQAASADIRTWLDGADFDPAELDRIDERLDGLFRLKKKYGGSIDAVLAWQTRAEAELQRLSDGEARYARLSDEKEQLARRLSGLAGQLSRSRRLAAARMEEQIGRELLDLGMKDVRFAVAFADLPEAPEHFGRHGLDQVEFLLSANPGEPLRPLARIASGGEASRIMLAIKTILAQADRIPVLIFDEIDSGVSGRTAGRVGEKLLQLAKDRQIFCITHMAQIAAMADEHYLIEKKVHLDRSRTVIEHLDRARREQELSRLLSGGVADATARQLAGQLLEQADRLKIAGRVH